MKISYFIKPHGKTVMARIKMPYGSFDISSKVKIIENSKFSSQGYFEGKDQKTRLVNRSIDDFTAFLDDKFDAYKNVVSIPTLKGFREFLKGNKDKPVVPVEDINFKFLLSEYQRILRAGLVDNKKTGLPLASGTVANMAGICSTLLTALETSGDLNISRFNSQNDSAIPKEEMNSAWDDFFLNFKRSLLNMKNASEDNFSDDSIAGYVNFMRSKMSYMAQKYGLEIGKYMQRLNYSSTKEKEVEVMSKEQTTFILSNYKKIRASLTTNHEEAVLDYWVAGLITASRVGDMVSWQKENIVSLEERNWLKYIPSKTSNSTGAFVKVPIPTLLQEIFDRNIADFGKPLPPVRGTSINPLMRKIARKYDVFKTPQSRTRHRGGKVVVKHGTSADFLHIHKTRATAITNMLSKGIPPHVVMEISGHGKGSKSFHMKYVKVHDDDKLREYDRYIQELDFAK